MRAFALPFCLLIGLPAFATAGGQTHAAVEAYNGLITQSFQKGFAEPVQASSNRYLVDVQHLAAYKMKVSKDPRCNAYVDLTLAASHSTDFTPAGFAARRKRVHQTILQGMQANCYVQKTPLEAMPYGLRIFWEQRHAKLSSASNCSPFVHHSTRIAFNEAATEAARKLALAELYVAATQRGCMRAN